METTEAFRGLECTACGETFDASEPGRCPDCDAPLDPQYDYGAVEIDREALSSRRVDSMWAFDELLPFADPVTTSEGGTPLVDAPALAEELGVGRVAVKDESRNPTGTVLDRGLSSAVTAAVDHGVEPLALASPGNAGQSAAAYAGCAGLRSYAFVPSRAPFTNKAMVNVHGGEMRVVGGRYPDAVEALHADLRTEWHSLQEFTSPYRHDGVKTVAYELARSLEWTVPDGVFVPTATGELVVGLRKGFRELREVGLLDDEPPLFAAQASGCAPIATAWEADRDAVEPWAHPDTICGELEVDNPAGGALAIDALAASGGDAVAVDDDDILESAAATTRHVGVEMGAAAGAGAAAAWELADRFDDGDALVLLNTEGGGKTPDILRSHLMGQGV